MMKATFVLAAAAAASLALLAGIAGCSSTPEMSKTAAPQPALEDGQAPIPSNYRSWPKFLTAVQRPDAKQVRDIYVNPIGYQAKAGQPFAHGTIFVMENYAVQLDSSGNPIKGADGKLVKAQLLRVFVMAKGPGFGSQVAPELKNGEWTYASYNAAGAKTADNLATCRSCHLPMANKDFVARYDEYFAARATSY